MSIMPIDFSPGIVGVSGLPDLPASVPDVDPAVSSGFGTMLADGMEHLQSLHETSDSLAVQAATGDLQDVHDYMIASTETSVATELTVAVRNKAVEAFTEIMRMQV